MSYLDTKTLNEDLKTVVHNVWTRTVGMDPHALNLKSVPLPHPVNILHTILGTTDMIDKKYFNSHWELDKSIKSKIAQWCKQAGGYFADTSAKQNRCNGLMTLSTNLMNRRHTAGYTNTRLATSSLGHGILSKSTTCIPINTGNGYYYVYPTFDSTDIYDLKVLCNTEEDGSGDFSVKKLNQWNSIDHEQFRKE
jgi:hypothetical protein